MKDKHVYFRSGALMLEGVVHWPNGDGPFPGVVVCHPHPLYGGDMDNNVVMAVTQGLVASGMVAIRFNFRGTGNSEGRYGDGVGEREDVRAALDFLNSQVLVDSGHTAVVGYSFGAFVGLAEAVGDERVNAVVGISPPLTMFSFDFFDQYQRPKLLVVGDRDEFAPLDQFRSWTVRVTEPKQVAIIPRASHFWIGHEEELVDLVVAFLRQIFGGVP